MVIVRQITRGVAPVQAMFEARDTARAHGCPYDYISGKILVDAKNEAVEDALKRSIEHSIRWEEATGHPARDMLRYGNHNALCYDITAGRISPWVIYNSEAGQKFLSDISADQVQMIWPYIDSDKWHKKFTNYPADQAWVKDILEKAGW